MIFKNIAEYEDTDSDLAKYTISQLHSKIDYLQDKIKELEAHNDIEGIYQCDEEGFEWIDKKTYDALYEKAEKLNNIINELEKHLQNEISNGRSEDNIWLMGCYDEDREILDKLQELKGDDKE